MDTVTIELSKAEGPQEAVKRVNALRLANKGKWLAIRLTLSNGRMIFIKSFDTWIQAMQCLPYVRHSTPMECSVTVYKNIMREYFADMSKVKAN